jgi:hypothetical protein
MHYENFGSSNGRNERTKATDSGDSLAWPPDITGPPVGAKFDEWEQRKDTESLDGRRKGWGNDNLCLSSTEAMAPTRSVD